MCKIPKKYLIALNLIAALSLALATFLTPKNGWDLLGHVGSALEFGSDDVVDLHAQVYRIAKGSMNDSDYQELVTGSAGERIQWSTDPEAYYQTLPFYQPRVLLTVPVYLLNLIDLDPVLSIRAITSLAAFGCYLFALLHFQRQSKLLIVFPVLALLAGLVEVGRVENADSIAAFFFLAAVYFSGKKHVLGLMLIAMLPLARSDTIILVVLLLPVLYQQFENRIAVVLAGLGAIVFYIAVNFHFGNYGWTVQFYVVHVEYLARPGDVHLDLSMRQYVDGLMHGLTSLIYNKTFLVFILFSTLLAACYRGAMKNYSATVKSSYRFDLAIVVVCILYVPVHFFVFPSMLTRYFAGQYLFVFLFVVAFFITGSQSQENT